MRVIIRSIISVFCVVGIFTSVNGQDSVSQVAVGQSAPAFSLPAIDGSREVLSVWCGKSLSKPFVNNTKKTVIISFWATYCEPCKKEIPLLHEFYEKYKNNDVKVFLISIDAKGAAEVEPFLKDHKYTLPILLDPYRRTASRYGVTTVPMLFVISPDGEITYISKGFNDKEPLIPTLEKIVFPKGVSVAKPPVPKTETPAPASAELTVKKKWNTVARLECGTPIDSLAKELGVKSETIKSWYDDVKAAAVKLWGAPVQK